MKKLLAFLYKNTIKHIFNIIINIIKCIFFREFNIYVHNIGNDNNSGFNSQKPKLTIASAVAAANAYPPSKNKLIRIIFRIVLKSDNRGLTIPRKRKRIKL